MHATLLDIAPTDLVDIAVVGLLLWGLVAWTRRVHARMAFLGLAFLGVFYLIAQQFKLQLTAWIFQGFFAVLVLIVVVVFQDDLRRLFEQIATLGLRRKAPRPDRFRLEVLIRGVHQLAAKKRGILLVLPGREPIERHLQGGVFLDAEISEELLDSLCDPGSAGHDGALVVRHNRIERCAVYLPLSENRDELRGGGTRHAAALGLAERSDALCLVVSEERGTIGIAARGQLEILDKPDALLGRIQDHLQHTRTKGTARWGKWRWLGLGVAEGLLSFALALGAWLVLVPGAAVEETVFQVPVVVENMPAGYALKNVNPPEVEIAAAGPRRVMLLASHADFQFVIDAKLVELGRRTFKVSPQSVRHATGLEVKSIKPEKVRLTVHKARN